MAVTFGLAGVKWADEDMAEAKAAEVTVKGFQCHVEGLDAILRILISYR